MPAPVAVLVEVDGEPVFQAYIAYCAICRGPCRGAPPPKVAYASPGKKKPGRATSSTDALWFVLNTSIDSCTGCESF